MIFGLHLVLIVKKRKIHTKQVKLVSCLKLAASNTHTQYRPHCSDLCGLSLDSRSVNKRKIFDNTFQQDTVERISQKPTKLSFNYAENERLTSFFHELVFF